LEKDRGNSTLANAGVNRPKAEADIVRITEASRGRSINHVDQNHESKYRRLTAKRFMRYIIGVIFTSLD
jgi:hypothetical protein